MTNYKFDRTAFKINTFEEADKANVYGKDVSYSERLKQAYFLILQVYGFSLSDQPKLERNVFSSRKLNN
jgi:hypothetical protein